MTTESTAPVVHAYLRVSTDNKGQTTDNQRKAIQDAGFAVDAWYAEEGVSGSIKALDRPEFAKMMAAAQRGDTCIVTMVDRLGRSAGDILHTVDEFKRLGIRLRVLQFDAVDVTSSMGKMILTVMAACAELERNLNSERTKAGMERAAAQGTIMGRRLVITPQQLQEICEKRAEGATYDQLERLYRPISRRAIAFNFDLWGNDLERYAALYAKKEAQVKAKKKERAAK